MRDGVWEAGGLRSSRLKDSRAEIITRSFRPSWAVGVYGLGCWGSLGSRSTCRGRRVEDVGLGVWSLNPWFRLGLTGV